MEKLLVLDREDYTDAMPVFEKYAVRAVIIKDGLFAMQQSAAGDYKLPGGTVEVGETFEEALIREVREETGLRVIPSSIKILGEIEEIRQDQFIKGQKYICHSLYYSCQVSNEMTSTQMTLNEQARGYTLQWATSTHIYEHNTRIQKELWTLRDTLFFKLLLDGKIHIL
ncbi:MAG: NUDIX hydrolase [Cellulosilyticaceae bacterium]